jgi:hypothetical protein
MWSGITLFLLRWIGTEKEVVLSKYLCEICALYNVILYIVSVIKIRCDKWKDTP